MTDEHSFLRKQARTQRFTLGTPREFRVAPDAKKLLFLRSESGVDRRNSLWELDLASGAEAKVVDAVELLPGEENLPPEERARRERSRESAGGVVGYATDAELRIAAFSLSGKLYTVDLGTRQVTELVDSAVVDPRPNPSGTHVAYVRDRRLRVIELATGQDRALVEEDGEDIAWGLAEFIAGEELGRSRGYWWSPDGTSLLVERSDRTGVPRWNIADPANPQTPVNTVAYPAAGERNVEVSLAIVGLDGTRVDVERGGWEYLVAVHWSAGGPPLLAVQSRDQRTFEIHAVDAATGATKLLHTETDPQWVEIVPGVPAWTSDGRLVRVSGADGSYRLVVDGVPVTEPGLQVRSVLDVGEEVLFSASDADSTQIHVHRTGPDGVRRLSTSDGVHVGAGSAAVTVLSSWSLEHSGPEVSVLRGGSPVAAVRSYPEDPGVEPRPRWLTVGERGLRAALLLPSGHEPGVKLPVLLDPYGGPHAQRVLQSRNAFLTSQWLADQGFAVLVTDGRGTPGRGPEWEKEVAGSLAEVTLTDQVDGLRAVAAEHPELDLERVAIRGWSYGGYLSALAVLRRPDVFHAAVAGAPVTDWSLYDTHYTERYLGRPQDDPAAYERNSLIADAGSLRRALLIVHGLADDNVFVAHALRLSSALLAAGRAHTFLPLVGATHMTPQAEEVAENLMRVQVDWIKKELNR
ncbi:prolyl oligopeptidase family serine peptidase [Amycolatopsis acidiphila]|uniref:S9 family peptidase n=1 Tax=Amycolatopsis acidiphila TaxID=715473 RepID=A0A557ZMN8_9PSEU|nr:prolyl oligopeptidase family serine peptidase [Amycolatopsis acidiphila]TVT13251.1 S9 family peptidase [Amycolatopsis acidiphila]UIJ58048.1 prolyl oligopeptidase family serine peptidase [Amycolatopsis acidiphila]GHG70416.1 dipeptidyl-peptidase 4 [Amycolatopsis acidiphila]